MLRFAVFALLVAAASAASVSPVSPSITAVGTRGVVEGVIPCGSKGEVLQIRVTDCTTLPCSLKVGSTYTVEVDFIPSVSHPSLTVLVSVIRNGSEDEIIRAEVPVAVEAGKGYTVAYPLTVTGAIVTGDIVLRIQVSEGGVTELCGLASAVVSN